jgi:hypothetical protein
MATPPLPHKSVRLSSVGFNKLYADVRNDPALAKVIADFIEADPKDALAHVFKLTKRQEEIIGRTSKAELLKRAEPLLTALRSETPGDLRFDPNPERKSAAATGPTKSPPKGGGGEHTETCTCAFAVPFWLRRKKKPPKAVHNLG